MNNHLKNSLLENSPKSLNNNTINIPTIPPLISSNSTIGAINFQNINQNINQKDINKNDQLSPLMPQPVNANQFNIYALQATSSCSSLSSSNYCVTPNSSYLSHSSSFPSSSSNHLNDSLQSPIHDFNWANYNGFANNNNNNNIPTIHQNFAPSPTNISASISNNYFNQYNHYLSKPTGLGITKFPNSNNNSKISKSSSKSSSKSTSKSTLKSRSKSQSKSQPKPKSKDLSLSIPRSISILNFPKSDVSSSSLSSLLTPSLSLTSTPNLIPNSNSSSSNPSLSANALHLLNSSSNSLTNKRKRKKHSEIERHYACTFNNCTKAYGTLNHLNTHIMIHKHGPKKSPDEFIELRKKLRIRKKDDSITMKNLKLNSSSINTIDSISNDNINLNIKNTKSLSISSISSISSNSSIKTPPNFEPETSLKNIQIQVPSIMSLKSYSLLPSSSQPLNYDNNYNISNNINNVSIYDDSSYLSYPKYPCYNSLSNFADYSRANLMKLSQSNCD